jgi:hypothetical protein
MFPQVVQSAKEVTRINKHQRRTTYHVTQGFQVSTGKIDIVEAAASAVGALLERGIAVSAEPLAYISTDLEQAKLAALEAATAEARRRAEIIVKGLGGKLGPMRASSLGVYQITPRNSTEVSDYGTSTPRSADTGSSRRSAAAAQASSIERSTSGSGAPRR